ncbi:unnamed protein product [Brugia pahangi]|uniref:Myb domain-containing protein n=1 Tax=Brugia pahangi TaxID=6280 RepID=A0A0N4T7G1_BRUPA|nr:unnamed protein product [Brugia pahangi]
MPSLSNFSVENLINNNNHHHHHHYHHHYRHNYHHHHQQQQQQQQLLQQPEKVYSSKPSLRQTSKADIISHSKVLSSNDNDITPLFATTTLNEIKTSTFNQQCQVHLAESDESPVECIPGTSREILLSSIITNQNCKSDYQNITNSSNDNNNGNDNDINHVNDNHNNNDNNDNSNNSTSSTSCHPIVCLSTPIPQTLSYFDVLLPHIQVNNFFLMLKIFLIFL